MKNITLSIPEDLLKKSREYAAKQGTSLNEFVRFLLKQAVSPSEYDPVQKLIDQSQQIKVKTKNLKWDRDELYDREIFS